MPSVNYVLWIEPISPDDLPEEHYYQTADEAIGHAELLTEDIGILYKSLSVVRYNWSTHTEESVWSTEAVY